VLSDDEDLNFVCTNVPWLLLNIRGQQTNQQLKPLR